MNADEHGCPNLLTEKVLAAVFEVSNTLGAGFLEKVYERALLMELRTRGIRATGQTSLAVRYKGQTVGEYFVDILVEDVLVVELKCVDHLANEHTAQCLNYLRASGRALCLLVNFQNLRSSGSALSCSICVDPCSSVAKNSPSATYAGYKSPGGRFPSAAFSSRRTRESICR
jgi:GxxExxY protein